MDQKSPDAFRTISEVAEWLGVPTHVLRFWESRFTQVKPVKRAGGRRYYRPSDMALLGGIRKLLHDDGMTIRGVQKLLREEGVKYVAAMSPSLDFEAGVPDGSNVVSLEASRKSAEPEIEEAEIVEEAGSEAEDIAADDITAEAAPEEPAAEMPQAPTEDAAAEEAAEEPAPVAATDDTAEEAEQAPEAPDSPVIPAGGVTSGGLPSEDDDADAFALPRTPDPAPEPPAAPEEAAEGDTQPEAADEPEPAPTAPPRPWDDDFGASFAELAADDRIQEPDEPGPEEQPAEADPEPAQEDLPPVDETDPPAPAGPEGSEPDSPAIDLADPTPAPEAPGLVMPDIADDPLDGALPPDIAPVAPRLRALRTAGRPLPAAELRAVAHRLEALRGGRAPNGIS